ncbi:MAG TPA: tRNA-dihydrouridine synthase [Gemmataceae bacterium]|jgi:tRNA-dihydrouridine synthase C|nr:tRNA-dihydrouridine synthase [Gemmataceae bacterium]
MLLPNEPAVVLAPMEGVTDAPMRAHQGSSWAFTYAVTEYIRIGHSVPGRAVFHRHVPELKNGSRTPTGLPVQVQLLGGDPGRMAEGAATAYAAGATAIDINFGCPAPTVNRHDGGATLLKHPCRIREIVAAVRGAVPAAVPVSAKLRLGWDRVDAIFENAAMAAEGGASWLTVHARTRTQGYAPPVYWPLIGRVREQLGIPVIANGDIRTIDDLRRCRDETGCRHFMLGRGAMADPRLARCVAAELGLVGDVRVGREIDWHHELTRMTKWVPDYFATRPERAVLRLKLWLRMAAAYGTFAEFEAVKRASSPAEVFAILARASGPRVLESRRHRVERTVPTQRQLPLNLEPLADRCLPSTYYVATTGNDSDPGSSGQPFATIQHALDVATHAGDVVDVRGGTYHEQLAFPASGNAKSGFITLAAYAGETPIIDGTGFSTGDMVTLENVNYVKIVGFEIAHFTGVSDGSGIRVLGGGSHIEIRNNRIHDIRGTSAMGITVYGTSISKPITDLIIDGNQVFDAEPAPSEALTLNGNVARFQVTGNIVHDVNNIGIDVIAGERDINRLYGARNGVVRGNTVYNAHSNYGGGFAAGIYVDGASNVVLEYNTSRHNDIGLEVGAENKGIVATGNIVRNNLIYQNDKAGLGFGGYDVNTGRVRSSTFTNNTLYQNDTLATGFGQLWVQRGSFNVVTNNIVYASSNGVLIASDVGNVFNTFSNNLYYAAGMPQFTWNGFSYADLGSYQAATKADAGSLFADPRLTDPANGDFHLLSDSPAIDAGSQVRGRFAPTDRAGRRRPQGGAPDIGAYEYLPPGPVVGPGLSVDQKRRAEALTSVFENDTIVIQYAYVEALHDGRGYTAGRAGFTSATSDLLDVVERFTAQVPGNPLAPFLPRLRALDAVHSGSIVGLAGLSAAWQAAADDPVFRGIQDQVVDETYYVPALVHVQELGLISALAIASVYDAIIQHGDGDDPDGLSALLTHAAARAGGTPATGVADAVWLDAFLHVRREDLAHAFDPATRAAWAESVARVDVLLQIASTGNYDLHGPIDVVSNVYTPVTIP